MDIESSKNLSGIGAILLIIGGIGSVSSGYAGLLSLIGIILMLIGIKGLADYYHEGDIFNNALYGFITTIAGGIAFIAILVATILTFALTTLPGELTDWAEWGTSFGQNFTDFDFLLGFLGSIIIAFVVLFIFATIAAIFYRKSFNILALKSGVSLFNTAGLLLLIGAILTIVLVGIIFIGVAIILLAVGFFSIKTTTATQPPETPPTPPS